MIVDEIEKNGTHKKSHNVLTKFTNLCWAELLKAILWLLWPRGAWVGQVCPKPFLSHHIRWRQLMNKYFELLEEGAAWKLRGMLKAANLQFQSDTSDLSGSMERENNKTTKLLNYIPKDKV